MLMLPVLVIVLVLCLILHDRIKRYPAAFYVAALLLDAVFVAGCYGMFPAPVWGVLRILMKEAAVAFSLFAVVMYVGVLPQRSKVRALLLPIRGELSIMAFFVALAHAAFYLCSYGDRFFSGAIVYANSNALVSLAVAGALLALLMVLSVTSFDALKRRMPSSVWKSVQRFSYLFFVLLYVHVACMLWPAAMSGRGASAASLTVYTVVFGLYFALRLIKAAHGRRRERKRCSGCTCSDDAVGCS
ncbi:ferric reductase-like transmembrane domain-containing protein [Eggerthella sinensis]|uniref:ferric reductase-like transmembrane domain-containing protein n=1 Tax=Eggerthella sinensis TaxID=242230 RepID=UPI0022E3965F|nr:ferric reductase-like transmembrane domain-containing protein [Eggerthella sinensis]